MGGRKVDSLGGSSRNWDKDTRQGIESDRGTARDVCKLLGFHFHFNLPGTQISVSEGVGFVTFRTGLAYHVAHWIGGDFIVIAVNLQKVSREFYYVYI